ncbi:tryptophan synthase subunit alpha [Methylobacterium oryzae CBMB20]
MADGPAIQAAGLRAPKAEPDRGRARSTSCAASAPENDTHARSSLMGYYNPIHTYGVDRFLGRRGGGRRSTG